MYEVTANDVAEIRNELLTAAESLNKVANKAKAMGVELRRIPGISTVIPYDHTKEAFAPNESVLKQILSVASNGGKTLNEQVRTAVLMQRIEEQGQATTDEAVKGL